MHRFFPLRLPAILLPALVLALLAVGGAVASVPASSQDPAGGAVVLSPEQAFAGQKLKNGWRFAVGDNVAWAAPGFDDSAWESVTLPHRWVPENSEEGWSWYRLRMRFAPLPTAQQWSLGLEFGSVMSAYELYAGGQLVGGVGRLPPAPDPVIDYDRPRIFSLPFSAVDANGELVLALRVWGGDVAVSDSWGVGPYRGHFRLARQDRLLLDAVIDQMPGLIVSIICVVFGFYHLYIYYRNRHLDSFLWFGLAAVVIGIYGLSLNQWRYFFGWEFAVYKKLEFAAIYLVPPLSLQGVWSLLDRPIGRWLRVYQLSFLLPAVLFVAMPGLEIHWRTLTAWQLWTLPALGLTAWRILRSMLEGHDEARTIALGAMLFIGTCLHDIGVDLLHLSNPRLLPWGFLIFVMSMAVSLANRMTAALGQLEQEVAERTEALEAANRRLTEAARVDPLTGLYNRRGFIAEAEVEIQRMFRTGRGFSLILADVDHFKSVNDRYGHASGDMILMRVASLLREGIRDADRVARWGGEEFILLLPETGADGAALLAEKLRERLADNLFEAEGHRLRISMTFGVSEFRRGESLEQCVARADAALYQGKSEGRNRVVLDSQQAAP
ncbi:sensor domain-containing diguanylate cyclase [Parahaliea mediterranea]|uniref:sensor domain-containing diguanylate cyclase n=1 Tax=Parahaliea mediterranea TaxID=651086 RepID=UPI000E2F46B3|nr:diguanylate cyclase [Parahaliea mediterranea]